MKKLLLTILTFSIVGSTVILQKNNILPGESSHDLEDLDPRFKKKISKLITSMEAKGYSIRVDQTYRSQERQDFLYHTPRIITKKLKLDKLDIDINVTSTLHSRHTRLKSGEKASCAVDLRPVGLYSTEQKAKFYKDLRDKAVSMRIRSGANFEKRKSSPYYKYGLGYDPGHIDIKCR